VETIKIETELVEETLEVRLIGEFDLQSFDAVDEVLGNAMMGGGHDLLVDLRGVTFIDSSGIRALMRAESRAVAAGRHLRLIKGPENVHRVFVLAGLDTRLDIANGDGS
jgi:anti-sigma B factor antagonist